MICCLNHFNNAISLSQVNHALPKSRFRSLNQADLILVYKRAVFLAILHVLRKPIIKFEGVRRRRIYPSVAIWGGARSAPDIMHITVVAGCDEVRELRDRAVKNERQYSSPPGPQKRGVTLPKSWSISGAAMIEPTPRPPAWPWPSLPSSAAALAPSAPPGSARTPGRRP